MGSHLLQHLLHLVLSQGQRFTGHVVARIKEGDPVLATNWIHVLINPQWLLTFNPLLSASLTEVL